MKKTAAFLLSVMMILLTAGCGKQEETTTLSPDLTLPNGFDFVIETKTNNGGKTGSTENTENTLPPMTTPENGETETNDNGTEDVPETAETVSGARFILELMFVNSDTLNMRSSPTTAEQNIIYRFSKGYCVTVISEENGWYRIKDDVLLNPGSGGLQTTSDYEGYVSKEWIVADYSEIRW